MSRIGKRPLTIPESVKAVVTGNFVSFTGPKGQLDFSVHDDLYVELKDNQLSLMPRTDSRHARSMWGMSRTRLANAVNGVSSSFETRLEIVGVGYRAAMQGKNLQLFLGYSHDVFYEPPAGITISVPKPTEIVVSGIDLQQVGQVAAIIRLKRPPEPYKGKGIRLFGERIVRKEGKKK